MNTEQISENIFTYQYALPIIWIFPNILLAKVSYQLYEGKGNANRVRSKCDWYEYGEKSKKFFLEKIRAHQNKIRKILKNGKEIADQEEVVWFL